MDRMPAHGNDASCQKCHKIFCLSRAIVPPWDCQQPSQTPSWPFLETSKPCDATPRTTDSRNRKSHLCRHQRDVMPFRWEGVASPLADQEWSPMEEMGPLTRVCDVS